MPHSHASPTACAGKSLNEWLKITFEGWQPPPQKTFVLSRYYTPVRGQEEYFRKYEGEELFNKAIEFGVIKANGRKYEYNTEGQILPRVLGGITDSINMLKGDSPLKYLIKHETEYRADFAVNCLGDCLSTASTYKLKPSDAYRVVACPKEYPFGTKFVVNGKTMVCWDRGGLINETEKTIRLDIWSGLGDQGLNKIRTTSVPYKPEVKIILQSE